MPDDNETTDSSAQPSSTQAAPSSTSDASSSPSISSSSPENLSRDTSSISSQPATTASSVVSINAPLSQTDNRGELIEKARSFLISPRLRYEDVFAKRRFLAEKGLSEEEIGGLLRELPAQAPLVPPRTYPPPPPSNLPSLLIGLARIITWITGGSAVLILIYYRYLLPLLTHSYQARLSIKAHQKDLLSKLQTSIKSLKETQAESFEVLPKPEPFKENPKYKKCRTLDEVVAANGEKPQEIPPFSVLRSALEDFAVQKKEADTQVLFQAIEAKLPWLQSEEGAQYQNDLWQTLSTHPLFSHKDTTTTSIWTYTPPVPTAPTALHTSLSLLRTSLPIPRSQTNPFQHMLQSLSDFTGYITTQIYSLPSTSLYKPGGFSSGGTLGPEEEELRKEIRALKGLVLNRRSFMNTVPRASSMPPVTTTP